MDQAVNMFEKALKIGALIKKSLQLDRENNLYSLIDKSLQLDPNNICSLIGKTSLKLDRTNLYSLIQKSLQLGPKQKSLHLDPILAKLSTSMFCTGTYFMNKNCMWPNLLYNFNKIKKLLSTQCFCYRFLKQKETLIKHQ